MKFYSLLIFNIINTFVIFDFFNRMYKRKYDKKWIYYISPTLFFVMHLYVNMLLIVPLNITYEIISMGVFSYFLYHERARKYFYNFLFVLYLAFMDSGAMAIYSAIKSQSLYNSLSNAQDMVISGIISFSMLICTYRFMIRILQKSSIEIVSKKQYNFFSFLILWETIIIVYFTLSENDGSGYTMIFFILSFLFLDIYIIYLFEFVTKEYKLKAENRLFRQQAEILNRNIHDMDEKYEQSRRMVHDMHNALQVLENVQANDPRVAQKYAEQMKEKLDELGWRFRCGHKIMTFIINNMIIRAKEKGICVDVKVQELDWRFLKEIDLTAIFVNIFNNAIEACEQMEDGNKFIKLRIVEKNNHVVIKMFNSYSKEHLIVGDPFYQTSKEGHSGIGLSNVQTVVEQYHGDMRIEVTDTDFIMKIILGMKEKKDINFQEKGA